MEPEVQIVEKYFQLIRHCFTMTNIRCKGNKEIDLLAVNPIKPEYYHVESRVSTTFKLGENATYTKDGRCHRDGLDYFSKEKFEHPLVKEKIRELFGASKYRKWLVVWQVRNENLVMKALHEYDIEIYWIHELIANLRQQKLTSGSRDVVMRMIEFFGKKELMTLNLRIIDLRRNALGEAQKD